MSTHEDDVEPQTHLEADYDDKSHQTCYIFKPSHQEVDDIDDRPKKRRKTSKLQVRDDAPVFPKLLGGRETTGVADLRYDVFHETWAHQQEKVDKIINCVDETALRDITRFVEDATPGADGRLPTGLVVAGLGSDIQSRLLKQWRYGKGKTGAECVVQFDSNQVPNLQTGLKNIIRTAIVQIGGAEGYLDFLSKHKKFIPMNFDLELLQRFAEDHEINKVVISILDVETFDMSTLSELVSALSCWSDRIHFVLLLGLATTVELFEARLPKSIIRLLVAKIFDLSTNRDINYEIFRSTQDDPETKLWLGATTCSILVEMTKDQDTTPESFSRAIKYVYMSHFFANPLSMLLSESDLPTEDELTELCQAIRNTASFQKHADEQFTGGKSGAQDIRNLLADDNYLLNVARSAIAEGQQKMAMTFQAIDAFKELPNLLMLQPPANASAFDIDMEALSGSDFINSDPYISIILILEKLRSDHLLNILRRYSLTSKPEINTNKRKSQPPLKQILQRLETFQTENTHQSIRNAYDPSHPSHATTVNQQGRVAITKQAVKLTPAEQSYTAIVDDLLAALESYFDTYITKSHYATLFMNEAFVYDLKVPLSGAFAPRPRYAVERALSRPADYLGCACCTGRADDASPKHEKLPPTSVLWKLWCEAGAFVNVRDLWEAFRDVLVGAEDGNNVNGDQDQDGNPDSDDGDDEEEDADAGKATGEEGRGEIESMPKMNERLALALFYRGLAELKMLGFVKASKKKPGVDCLAKTTWAGL